MNYSNHMSRLVLRVALVVLAAGPAFADTLTKKSSFGYDDQGFLIRETVEPDVPNSCLTTNYTLDSFGNKVSKTASTCSGASGASTSSASARTTTATFSADGIFPLTTTNAVGHVETRLYNNDGLITSLTGPNGLVTTWEYDSFGRKTREVRADGTYTTWAYVRCPNTTCPASIGGVAPAWVHIEKHLRTTGSANWPEQRQFFDAQNRLLRTQKEGFTDPQGNIPLLAQDVEYDSLGRVSRRSNNYDLNAASGARWTEISYDSLGRVSQERKPSSDALGSLAVTSYSFNGLTTAVTNAANQTQTTTKNAEGQVASIVDAASGSLAFSYDAEGKVLSTNAGGVLSTLAYDKRGNKVAMADPVMGSWAYDYNVFGELVSQTDSLNRITTYVYDKLGRNTKRTEPDLVSEWSFDKMFDGSACGKSLGVLCEAKSDNGYRRVNTYDSLSRLVSTGNSLDNSPTLATVSASYSSDSGRVAFRTWPTGLQAAYSYTSRGYPQHVQVGGNAGFPETMTMTIDGMDANGNVTSYRQGGQLIKTDKQFNDVTGVLALQTVTANGGTVGNVLKQAYTYDKLDNLYLRKDDSPGVGISESFSYDSLNRVREYLIVGNGVSPPRTTGILYDARGNITYKSDVGQYVYDASRPNRLKSIALTTPAGAPTNTGTRAFTFAFDDAGGKLVNGVATGDGNVVETLIQDSATGLQTYRRQVYTSYKMPSSIALGGYAAGVAGPAQRTVSFAYGPEHQRIKEQSDIAAGAPGQSAAGTTWFLNGEDGVDLTYEKEVFASGLVEHRHYLNLAGLVFGIRTTRAGVLNGAPATSGRYLHHDHLGSLVAVTDEGGTVVERLAYDPWGKRRLPDGNADPLGQLIGQQTSRGFTMHEHLDRLGAINMNGRIYDPTIGRFLSADPFIQSPSNLQSYNRYSYVLNNPLAYTDPSGHFSLKKLVRGIVAVVASFYTGQWAGGWSVWGGSQTLAGSIATGVAGGFTGGVINSGTLKGGLYGALSGGAFGAVGYGTEGWSDLSKVAAHAAVGCATQSIAGGSCKAGALSAGFSKWATVTSGEGGEAADFNDVVAIGIKSSLIGGVASVLGGGKFEDGVLTAAYGYIFNQIAHNLTNAEKKAWGESYAESKLALTSDQIIRNAKGYAIVNGQRVGIEIDRIIIDSTGNYIKAVEVKWGESASYTGNQRVTSVQVARGDIYITNQNLINPNKTLANQSQSYEHRIFTINATRVIRSSVTATRLKNGARLTSTWFAPFASGIQ